jgi:hypothetical protein
MPNIVSRLWAIFSKNRSPSPPSSTPPDVFEPSPRTKDRGETPERAGALNAVPLSPSQRQSRAVRPPVAWPTWVKPLIDRLEDHPLHQATSNDRLSPFQKQWRQGIIGILERVPPEEQTTIFRLVEKTLAQDALLPDLIDTLLLVEGMSLAHRAGCSRALDLLVLPTATAAYRRALLARLSKVPDNALLLVHWIVLQQIPLENEAAILMLVCCYEDMPVETHADIGAAQSLVHWLGPFAGCLLQEPTIWDLTLFCQLVAFLAATEAQRRPMLFVQAVSRVEPTVPDSRRAVVEAYVEIKDLDDASCAEWVVHFAEFVEEAHGEDPLNLLTSCVRSLPPVDRNEVCQKALGACRPDMTEQDVVDAIQRAAEDHQVAVEQSREVAQTRRDRVPRIDTENVMSAQRREQTDALIGRLVAARPGYVPQHADIQEISNHLIALWPQSCLSTESSAAQWADFALYLGDVVSEEPRLAALLAAMRQPPADGRVPAAWLHLLADFPKRADCCPGERLETMADYLPPDPRDPSTGIVLATWLGHLAQFAYRSVDPLPIDRQIAGFCASLYAYEVDRIPVLARVRGRTQATELANAARVLSGPGRPGDFPIPDDFDALCGLVWQEIKRGTAQQQANDRHSFVLALARCIEDDGHRICGVGQTQQFMAIIQPQDATPRELLTALAEAFAGSSPEPSPEQQQAFMQRAMGDAEARYGAGTAEVEDFAGQLNAYMELTYGEG